MYLQYTRGLFLFLGNFFTLYQRSPSGGSTSITGCRHSQEAVGRFERFVPSARIYFWFSLVFSAIFLRLCVAHSKRSILWLCSPCCCIQLHHHCLRSNCLKRNTSCLPNSCACAQAVFQAAIHVPTCRVGVKTKSPGKSLWLFNS